MFIALIKWINTINFVWLIKFSWRKMICEAAIKGLYIQIKWIRWKSWRRYLITSQNSVLNNIRVCLILPGCSHYCTSEEKIHNNEWIFGWRRWNVFLNVLVFIVGLWLFLVYGYYFSLIVWTGYKCYLFTFLSACSPPPRRPYWAVAVTTLIPTWPFSLHL